MAFNKKFEMKSVLRFHIFPMFDPLKFYVGKLDRWMWSENCQYFDMTIHACNANDEKYNLTEVSNKEQDTVHFEILSFND
jgi:hypothetical protein